MTVQRTKQDMINRREANRRYYKLEENKQQKRNYMKDYAKRPEVKAKAKEYYRNNIIETVSTYTDNYIDHLKGKYGQEIEQAEDLHAQNSERFVNHEKKSD